MSGETAKRSFHTLDGLRGVAAIFIVGRHVRALFGAIQAPESFLAVDLFFALSGFVIAYSYDAKLKGGGFADTFMVLRFIRLYPLYLIGFLIGAAHLASLVAKHDAGRSGASAALSAIAGLFILPAPAPDGALTMALNIPTWTLFIELFANGVFGYLHRHLTTRVLAAIAAVSAIAIVAVTLQGGSVDARYYRILVGVARVGFSFSAGVLISRRGVRNAVRPLQAGLALAALAIVLAFAPAIAARPAYEIVVVLLVFPALVWWAAGVEPGNRGATRAMTTLGLASYAVYVLHEPLGFLAQSASVRLLHFDLARAAPWSGLAYVVALIAISLALDRYYDQPVRRWLRRHLEHPPRPPSFGSS